VTTLPDSIEDIRVVNVWQHGHASWCWSNDYDCFITEPLSQICLGERYARVNYKRDGCGIEWSGSEPDSWDGWEFICLRDALGWVQDAARADLEDALWRYPIRPRRELAAFLEDLVIKRRMIIEK